MAVGIRAGKIETLGKEQWSEYKWSLEGSVVRWEARTP